MAFSTLQCANIFQGKYRYLEDLLALGAGSTQQATASWPLYTSLINLSALNPFLSSHPDRQFALYILSGLWVLGRHNYSSSLADAQVINECLQSELAANRLLGPIPSTAQQSVHTSPLGLVPKPGQQVKDDM